MRPTGSELSLLLSCQSSLLLRWFLCSHFIPSFVSFQSFCNVGCRLPIVVQCNVLQTRRYVP